MRSSPTTPAILASVLTLAIGCSGGGHDTNMGGGDSATPEGDSDSPGDSDTSPGDDDSPGDTLPPADDDVVTPVHVQLSGAFQKGPFLQGSSVSLALIDDTGSPTGDVFPTETTNQLGEFAVALDVNPGQWASVEGTGYYYNEITGQISSSTLTLRAYFALGNAATQSVYINIITHLSYNRIKTLVGEGTAFAAASQQAEHELQQQLGIGASGLALAAAGTAMNIVGDDTLDNAYLLAVSSVLTKAAAMKPGALEGNLQELVNSISLDLAPDGIIEATTRAALLAAEKGLDVDDVTRKLAARLAAVGSAAVVPNLGAVIDNDKDGQANAADCLPFDAVRWTGHADQDADGHVHIACGGDDCNDDCPTCYPGALPMSGDARDHDCDGMVDEITEGICPQSRTWSIGAPHTKKLWQSGNGMGAGTWAVLLGNNLIAGSVVVDLADSAHPKVPATEILSGTRRPVIVGEHLVTPPGDVFLSPTDGWTPGLLALDVANVSAITSHIDARPVWTSPQVTTEVATTAHGLLYFVATVAGQSGLGLYVADMKDPEHVQLLGSPATWSGSSGTGIAIRNDRAYVSFSGGARLAVIDVSSPAAPAVVNGNLSYDPALESLGQLVIDPSSAYLYAIGQKNGHLSLHILSMANKDAPTLAATLTPPGLNEEVRNLWVGKGVGLVTTYESVSVGGTSPYAYLYRLDLSDPGAASLSAANELFRWTGEIWGYSDVGTTDIAVSGQKIVLFRGLGSGFDAYATTLDITCGNP